MTLTELQTLIGVLANDPNHDRYSISDINTELDNSQRSWNIGAKVIKDTVTLTVVDGTRQYALTDLGGTPISFDRVTHKGLSLNKRSKQWFDLYAKSSDWTLNIGTPTDYFIEARDPANQFLTLYPTPQSGDAGAYLVVEFILDHTPMSASSDVPFMLGTSSNYLIRPYDFGLAYDAAAKLLMRDPTPESTVKAFGADGKHGYKGLAEDVLSQLIQVFLALEKQEPPRLRGGRYWNTGNVTTYP